jgi:DNA polymerase-3 subunit gamma/tau
MNNEAVSTLKTDTTTVTLTSELSSSEIKKEDTLISMPSTGGTPLKTNSSSGKKPAIKLPSIADIKSGKFELKKEEKQEEVVLPTNDFSYGDFKHYWDEAIAQIGAKNQASINVMIANLQPELKDNTNIHLQFNNKIQLELFQSEKPFIAGYLREKLQNYNIDFVIEMNTTELDSTPYTNAEKFKSMSSKNPNLQVLRDVLGLDIS